MIMTEMTRYRIFSRKAWISISICLLLFLCLPLSSAHAADADRDRALEILNSWTSIRWGEENLAWVVYYPEALIDPWVKAETARKRMRPDQAAAYRNAFVDELRIDSTTPILFSIQVLGTSPPDITPLSEHIFLVDSTGKRVRPMVIEKSLQSNFQGLTQGLIFFPKQTVERFSIVVQGLVPGKETHFFFDGAEHGSVSIATAPSGTDRPIAELPSDEIIVKIPTTSVPETKKQDSDDEVEVGMESETFAPTVPPQEPSPPEPSVQEEMPAAPASTETEQPRPVLPKGTTPRRALDIYLRSWIAGDTETMYQMLSADSKAKISRELFDREINGSSFKNLLKSGYKVSWISDTKAKVTVARKLLLLRSLESRSINFIIEDGEPRVSW